jgi:hypothetical protein
MKKGGDGEWIVIRTKVYRIRSEGILGGSFNEAWITAKK